MKKSKENLIKLAFVTHAHGIKGEAEVRLLNSDVEQSILDNEMRVWLFPGSTKSKIRPDGEEWIIEKLRFGNKVIAQFKGIKDRTHLDTLMPFDIYLDRESFPETDGDEIYLVDLIGMKVVNPEGEEIGMLESFSENGAQYLFNIRMGGRGELVTLPYVDAFFSEIDMEKKTITMILPEYSE